jgi:hypothetical protein
MNKRPRRLTCSVCGGPAYGKQHWNRDTGFGCCPNCYTWMVNRGRESVEEIERSYGKPGVNIMDIPNR